MQMGAFGRRLRPGPISFMDPATDPNAAPVANASIATPQAMPANALGPKPMGAFGRIRHWATPEHLQALGATFRQLGGVDGALDRQLQMQQQGRESLAEQTRQAMEDKYRQQQHSEHNEDREMARQHAAQLEEIISQLPPDQQALARLDPEGYVRGIMRNRYPAPSRAGGGVNSSPSLPDGFQWED